jgi:hypothetical protein
VGGGAFAFFGQIVPYFACVSAAFGLIFGQNLQGILNYTGRPEQMPTDGHAVRNTRHFIFNISNLSGFELTTWQLDSNSRIFLYCLEWKVVGLIAPRVAVIVSGRQDQEGDLIFANEMNARAAQPVFDLTGNDNNALINTILKM